MRTVAIINPYAKERIGKSLVHAITKNLSQSLVEIYCTQSVEESTEVARRAAREGFDAVVAVGGDGTVNAVLNGLVGSGTALGIIPTGTANDLACYHAIPNDIRKACEILTQNHVTTIDLICVNGRYYATDGGIGVPCEIARRANAFKQDNQVGKIIGKFIGSQLYVLTALRVLLDEARRATRLTIQSNGNVITTDATFLMINNQHTVGKNFLLSPGAENDDGVFDVCLVEHVYDLPRVIQLLGRCVNGTHTELPFVKIWKERKIRVQTEAPMPYLADGEILEKTADFVIELHPRALNVITPLQPNAHHLH
jgi:YegS/Rv2252/BmrU family lipid kinase